MTIMSPALMVSHNLLAMEPPNSSPRPQPGMPGHSPTFFKAFASQLVIFISVPVPTNILGKEMAYSMLWSLNP